MPIHSINRAPCSLSLMQWSMAVTARRRRWAEPRRHVPWPRQHPAWRLPDVVRGVAKAEEKTTSIILFNIIKSSFTTF